MSAGWDPGSVAIDLDQIDYSKNADGLQMTASHGLKWKRDLYKIDEICFNVTVELNYLLVKNWNFEWQTNTHHIRFWGAPTCLKCWPFREHFNEANKSIQYCNVHHRRDRQPTEANSIIEATTSTTTTTTTTVMASNIRWTFRQHSTFSVFNLPNKKLWTKSVGADFFKFPIAIR